MTEHAKTTVLITGASSGIGAALAREFCRRGHHVALVARRVAELENLATELRAAGGHASVHGGDVTKDGDVARAVADLAAQGITPGIVIANAGFGVAGNAQSLTLADYRRQFATNIEGVLRTFHESLACLRAARGRFVVMGSVAGYVATPGGSAYAMSKFAVRAFAEALHAELRPAGIGVTLISPGFVQSDIRRIDNRGALHPDAREPIPDWLLMPADRAARVMVDGILRGRREVIVTFHGKVLVFVARHFPWLLRLAARHGLRNRREPGSQRT